MSLRNVRLISFDCYGTLIDWESGIITALQNVLRAHALHIRDDEILAAYSRFEPRLQTGPWRPYREILRGIIQQFGQLFGFQPTEPEQDALSESLPGWGPFPDTNAALHALERRYRLAVLSNIDNDLFAATARRLDARFDLVVTAEDVRSYKPGLTHFRTLLTRTGLPPEQHVHVAESLYHDIAPATRLGIPNVWVQRRHGQRAAMASPAADCEPDHKVRDLAELVALLDAENA